MEQLKFIPYLFLIIGVSAIIGGAVALVLAEFSATTTDATALSVIANGSLGVSTIAQQLPTISIIAVMVIIIGLIVTVFVYFQYFR